MKKIITCGLQKLPDDTRDFEYHKVFGSLKKEYPDHFIVSEPLKIKDQGSSDFCTAFALSSVSEDQEKVEINPQFIFAMTRKIDNKGIESYGANLRDACKAVCKFGSIEEIYYPFPDKDIEDPLERAYVANYKNWPDDVNSFAWEYAKNSFFRVDKGPYDVFDNLRSALVMNKEYNRSIFTGCDWYDEWTSSKNGIISEDIPKKLIGGHAFKIFGFTKIEDTEYLIAQLSNGEDIGDAGIFYFPRGIVNTFFTYGAFMFHDMPRERIEHMIDTGIGIHDTVFQRIGKTIINIIKNIYDR